MLPESPPDSGSEPCSPPQIPGNNQKQFIHVYMISHNFSALHFVCNGNIIEIGAHSSKEKENMLHYL